MQLRRDHGHVIGHLHRGSQDSAEWAQLSRCECLLIISFVAFRTTARQRLPAQWRKIDCHNVVKVRTQLHVAETWIYTGVKHPGI